MRDADGDVRSLPRMSRAMAVVFLSFTMTMIAHGESLSLSVLAGLKEVTIHVDPLSEEAEAFKLSDEGVVRRMRDELAQAGLAIRSTDDGADIPSLVVKIRILPVRGVSHLYTVELALSEYVRTERELPGLDSFPATTWSRSSVGIANAPRTVLDVVSTLARSLVAEHRKEN